MSILCCVIGVKTFLHVLYAIFKKYILLGLNKIEFAGLQEAGNAMAPRQVPVRGGQEGRREEVHGYCRCQRSSH